MSSGLAGDLRFGHRGTALRAMASSIRPTIVEKKLDDIRSNESMLTYKFAAVRRKIAVQAKNHRARTDCKIHADSNASIGGSAGSLMARETFPRVRGWLRTIAQERPTADPPPAMRNNWSSSGSPIAVYNYSLLMQPRFPEDADRLGAQSLIGRRRSHELSPRPKPYRVAFGQETPIPSAQACLRLPGKLETQTSVSSPALSRRARDCASRLLVSTRSPDRLEMSEGAATTQACPRAIQP